MTDSTPGARGSDPTARPGQTPPETGRRRRLPAWLLAVLGVLVVAAIVTGVLLLANRDDATPVEVPEAETVTLPVPTPTVDPIEREDGTAFEQALPSTVLAYALTAVEDDAVLVDAGALEGYRLQYTDGSQELTVRAGQWATAEEAQEAFAAAAAGLEGDGGGSEEATATEEPAESAEDEGAEDEGAGKEPVERSEGAVEVDGEEVGRYLIVPSADGTGTALWTNGTVLLQVDGPATALDDVFAAFPL